MSSIHDTIFKTLHYPIENCRFNLPYYLRFISDVHYSARCCDKRLFHSVLKKMASNNERAYYITGGDLNDFASASERMILKGGLHESTQRTLDEICRDQIYEVCERMEFMRGKFIGSVEGNHKWEFVTMFDHMTSDQVMAKRMGGHWLGGLCIVTLAFRFKGPTNKAYNLDLAIHHGKAGGKLIGTSFNQVADMERVVDADIYAMGHNHQVGAIPGFEQMRAKRPMRKTSGPTENLGVTNRAKWYARMGSFLHAYEVGQPNYAVSRLYPPSALGAMELSIEFRRKQSAGKDTIIPIINGNVVR